MTNASKDQGREAFEAWMAENRPDAELYRRDVEGSTRYGEYCKRAVQDDWILWQAALATSASALARDEASVALGEFVGYYWIGNDNRQKFCGSFDTINAETAKKAQKVYLAAASSAATKRCEYCDGTGDVHGIDGEWRGECTECDAASSAATVSDAASGLMDDRMREVARQYCVYDEESKQYDILRYECEEDLLNFVRAVSSATEALTSDSDVRDAARYRWLRSWYLRGGLRAEIHPLGHIVPTTPSIIDGAIDAAIAQSTNGEQS